MFSELSYTCSKLSETKECSVSYTCSKLSETKLLENDISQTMHSLHMLSEN
jgi:hypothetical protein